MASSDRLKSFGLRRCSRSPTAAVEEDAKSVRNFPYDLDLVRDEVMSRLPLRTRSICRCVCKFWYYSLASDSIVFNILSRLPVKSLLRFRSVSKLWRSIIDDPHFIRAHYDVSRRTMSCYIFVDSNRTRLFTLDGNGVATPNLRLHPNPAGVVGRPTLLTQSCHGLVLIVDNRNDSSIYNPATGKSRILPPCLIRDTGYRSDLFALGFDTASKMFKVVHMGYVRSDSGQFEIEDRKYNLECEVFTFGGSSSSCSWRKIGRTPFELIASRNPPCADGVIYWTAIEPHFTGQICLKIVAFHLADEQFHLIRHPSSLYNTFELGTIDGHLLASFAYTSDSYHLMHTWLLQDPLGNSWVEDVALLPDDLHADDYIPVGICNGRVLFYCDGHLFDYNLNNKRFKRLQVVGYGYPQVFRITHYVESLVPLW